MSTFTTTFFLTASRLTYAAVVRGQSATIENPPVPTEERSYSRAELNAGSVALHQIDSRRMPPYGTVLVPPPFSMAELNAGSERILTDACYGTAAPKPIGAERHPAVVSEPRYYPAFNAESTYLRPIYPIVSGPINVPAYPSTYSSTDNLPLRGPEIFYVYPPMSVADAHTAATVPTAAEYAAFDSPPSRAQNSSRHFDNDGRATALDKPWKSCPFTIPPDITIGLPSSPAAPLPNPRPRKKKYYGQFEACSRVDVLPEFADEDDDEEAKAKEADDGDYCAGWSIQEFQRHMGAVRARFSAAFLKHAQRHKWTESEAATGLLDLPAVVEVRPVYPSIAWAETVSTLERQSIEKTGKSMRALRGGESHSVQHRQEVWNWMSCFTNYFTEGKNRASRLRSLRETSRLVKPESIDPNTTAQRCWTIHDVETGQEGGEAEAVRKVMYGKPEHHALKQTTRSNDG
ncbi:hypothetical protein C8R45DRAFT_935421 [Mycena sanguinolenta]|nr:hypothetical protein C8R45DRAFT_935421 [Mycena sanguinolenta]